jgi:hypothetical protein
MFHGTTIDDLLNIVERAEEHARTSEIAMGAKPEESIPAFLFEMTNQPVWYGVA